MHSPLTTGVYQKSDASKVWPFRLTRRVTNEVSDLWAIFVFSLIVTMRQRSDASSMQQRTNEVSDLWGIGSIGWNKLIKNRQTFEVLVSEFFNISLGLARHRTYDASNLRADPSPLQPESIVCSKPTTAFYGVLKIHVLMTSGVYMLFPQCWVYPGSP